MVVNPHCLFRAGGSCSSNSTLGKRQRAMHNEKQNKTEDMLKRIKRTQEQIEADRSHHVSVDDNAQSVRDLKDGVSTIAAFGRWARKTGDTIQKAGGWLKGAFNSARGVYDRLAPPVAWTAGKISNAFRFAAFNKDEDGERHIDRDLFNWKRASKAGIIGLTALFAVSSAVDVAVDGLPMAINSHQGYYYLNGVQEMEDGTFRARGCISEECSDTGSYYFRIEDNAYIDIIYRMNGLKEGNLDRVLDGYDPAWVASAIPDEATRCFVDHHGYHSRAFNKDYQMTGVTCSLNSGQPIQQLELTQ